MPDWRARVAKRLAGLRLDPATEREVIDELTQHLEDRYRDLLARGARPDTAAVEAWRELEGHPRLSREIASVRMAWPLAPIQHTARGGLPALWDDLVFAWRRLRHAPGFTVTALLTITLTVGVNTAILSIADAVLFRPLPYADADELAILQVRDRKSGAQSTLTPYSYLHAINAACPSVSDVGGLDPVQWPSPAAMPRIDTPDGPASVPTMAVTSNYFGILGVLAARGRLFNDNDAGREGRAAVLSHAAWLRIFGGDESVVGNTITLGTATFDLLGVLPPGFIFPSPFAGRPSLVVLRKPFGPEEQGGTFHPIVRIAKGVSRERAQAEVEAAASTVTAGVDENPGVPVLNDVRTLLYPVGRPIMRLLLAAAVFILLLGCANLANMMLVRGRRGLTDTAVRLALGASRGRLIRPMFLEALMLGLGGALLAVGLTAVTFDALLRQVPPVAYGRADVGVDYRVLLIALAMGLTCATAFGIVPAWRAAGVDAIALIRRRGGRGSQVRIGRPLVALQVAIAVAVIFGAIVAGRAFVSVLNVPVGFSSDRVVRVELGMPADLSRADRRAAIDRVVDALARRPDVEAVGAAGAVPFSGRAPDAGVRSADGGALVVGLIYALPGYFEAVGLQPHRGRTLVPGDRAANPDVAVLSSSAAKTLFGDRDPIGAHFDDGRGRRFQVVGVVGDVRNFVDRETAPLAYAMPPPERGLLTIVAKTRTRAPGVLSEIKADARRTVPGALTTVEWWEDGIAANTGYRNPRFQTLVLSGLAALALGLTALGIFSVIAYLVAARTREMGVRLAIGASPRSLVGLLLRQALAPIAIGLAAGLVLIQWGKQLAEAQLFKVETADPLALIAASVTVVLAGAAAAYWPARRATKINPVDVLRAE
jgi:putative ABC transport system permease protein